MQGVEECPRWGSEPRRVEEKETQHLVTTILEAEEQRAACAPDTHPVFVLDRGFDCWPVLALAGPRFAMVARATHDRRLEPQKKAIRDRSARRSMPLRSVVTTASRSPKGEHRPASIARMELRTAKVTIVVRTDDDPRVAITLNAVLAREIGGPKGGALRWRIEELHRLWKRGGCDVEDTWLPSREGIQKWATLHCAVAARALRLTHLARTQPDLPALEEFTQDEIDATIVLRRKRTTLTLGATPTLHAIVERIAALGGYTGKSSGGPPGPTVIARGLEKVAVAAEVVALMRGK